MTFYQDLQKKDVIGILKNCLMQQGWYIDMDTGLLTCKGRASHDPERPWVYVNPDPERKCGVYTAIADNFGFIPQPCLDCWKVVVKPRTVKELMELYKLQMSFSKDHEGTDRFCKCGIEIRDYVPQNYGGYFYCNSQVQGLKRWQEVRDLVDKINPKIPVTLKRYCTEFELRYGDSDKYEQAPGAEELQKEIFDVIDWEELNDNPPQPDSLVNHILVRWIKHAWNIADMTCILFNGNQPLMPPSVTYHDHLIKKGLSELES